MNPSDLIGNRKEKQLEALGYLVQFEGMSYHRLRDQLDLEQDEMQDLMREINFNGLVKRSIDDTGTRVLLPEW